MLGGLVFGDVVQEVFGAGDLFLLGFDPLLDEGGEMVGFGQDIFSQF